MRLLKSIKSASVVSVVVYLLFAVFAGNSAFAQCSNNFSVQPIGGFTAPSSGGAGFITIYDDNGCQWSAYSTNTSMTVALTNNSGTTGYSDYFEILVKPNTSISSRYAYWVVQQAAWPYIQSNVLVYQNGSCGNAICEEEWENHSLCPVDCKCGDGICQAYLGENNVKCSVDCYCGNGTCESGENYSTCPSDCTCGDGICQSGELSTCPGDCPQTCQQVCTNSLNNCLGGIQSQCTAGCGSGLPQACSIQPQLCIGAVQQCMNSCINGMQSACYSQYNSCTTGCN